MHPTFARRKAGLAVALIVLLALGLLVAGCAGGTTPTGSDQNTTAPPESEETTEQDSTQQEEQATPGEEPVHVSTVKVKGDEVAVITTNKGVIEFTFFAKDAPNTVASFIELAQKSFYDGTKFHRVEPNFVVQGGDPYSKTGEGQPGTGGPGYRLKAEFNQKPHLEGTVAMARSQDPDSAGSQFYICLAPQPGLDGQYTVFGQVTKGMDVVKKIQVGDVMESVKIRSGK